MEELLTKALADVWKFWGLRVTDKCKRNHNHSRSLRDNLRLRNPNNLASRKGGQAQRHRLPCAGPNHDKGVTRKCYS